MKARLSLGIFIAVFVIVVSLVSLVFAYPEGWGEDIRVTFAPSYSWYPSLAMDSNNNVHIAWYDYRDGNYEIYYTKLDNNGNTLVEDRRLTFDPSGSKHPSLAMDSNNNVHIAWVDYRDGNSEIYYTKLDNNGNTLVDDTRLTFASAGSYAPSLAMDSNNNVHIAWVDYRDGYYPEIYYTKLDNNGNTLVEDMRLTFDPADSWYTSLAMDSNNNVHIAWIDYRDGNDEIYYTKLDNNGNTLVDDRRLTFAPYESSYPSLAMDSNNNVHIAWVDYRDGNYEIYYTKLDNNGNTLVDDRRLTFDPASSWFPSLAIDSNNNVHIAWGDYRDGNSEIYYTKLDNNGNTLVDDRRLTFDPADSGDPSLALDSNNNVHIAWDDYRDGNYEIYYKRSYFSPLPDLAIAPEDISHNPENPLEEQLVTTTLTVHNIGTVDAYNVRVNFYLNGQLKTSAWMHVLAGSSTNETFFWTPATGGTYTTYFIVDPDDEIEESDETNNEASTSIDVTSYKYEILAIPLNWRGNQQEFDNAVNTQLNFFLNDVPLNACRERVKIKIPDTSRYNFNFTCSPRNCNVNAIRNFANQIEGIGELEEYDVIAGLAETSPCPPIAGCSNGVDTIWVTSSYEVTTAHEIGHLFGLEDEYCSNPAGSWDSRCNDGGPPYGGSDINYLDANLGCDPRDGFGCCGPSAGLSSCSNVNYGVCCLGNVNYLGGRATMSYANAPDPRAFDDHSRAHLASQPKLNCEFSLREAEIVDIIDVNFVIYQNDSVNDNGIILVQGEPSEYQQTGGNYNLTVLDNESNILFVQSFAIYFDYMGPIESGVNYSGINYTFVDLSYKIPYSENMYELRLYKNDIILFSKILNFCNFNDVCESDETYLTCPSDCPLDQPDGICILENDGICDPDCAKGLDFDCAPTLQHINNITKVEGSLVVIVANATDPDDENLTYSIDDPRFTQNNNIFIWQTHYGDAGFYEVTISVTDNYLEDSQAVGIRIYRYPKPPLPYELFHGDWW